MKIGVSNQLTPTFDLEPFYNPKTNESCTVQEPLSN